MSKHLRKSAILLAALLVAAPVAADEKPVTGDSVVATVNGTEITVGHMVVARMGLPEQYRQLPDEMLYQALIDQLINQALLEQSYKGDTPARVQKSLENQKRTLVASEAIELLVAEKVTEEALKAAYEEKFAAAAPSKEYNAAHILVETEDEAKLLIEKLDGGADFAKLAETDSTGPSGPNGGSLGWFGAGMMVAPFEDAVKTMEAGAISAPVKTQFGWHVIKLLETRVAEAPAFEEVRDSLQQDLYTKTVEAEIERLKKLGKIEITDPTSIDPALLKDQTMVGE
ncbi:peptidylprolyl isomerase [Lentibacter algarum]|uniref:peptidylprolyl isomerase n=1 Tax=Lentibacter algarum TaxID=576131 RepID=UPI001C07D7DB|nr:peptidylprolyl isomerase [Lentibacter algarum]MBU2981067.1 peptidylprolyl isomerase [Lentibacter algarum]